MSALELTFVVLGTYAGFYALMWGVWRASGLPRFP